MNNKIIIDDGLLATRAAFVKEGVLCDFLWESKVDVANIGDIYKGRIIKMDESMDACLVDIGLQRPAYLGKTDMVLENKRVDRHTPMKSVVKTGDDVLVQISRLPIDTKGAKVSMRLEIAGDYLVYFPEQSHVGFSRQISEKDKQRLNVLLEDNDIKGLIFRTNCKFASKDQILDELSYLKKRWEKVKQYRVLGKAPKKVYSATDVIHQFINRYKETSQIIFNSSHRRNEFCQSILSKNYDIEKMDKRSLQKKTDEISTLYKEVMPIFEKYNVEGMLRSDLSSRIELNGGGFLVVEETESCVFIDVNSGWSSGKKNLELTAYKTNIEAASEIARLLRVRNLSGIILIDFIDMIKQENKEKLIDEFTQMVKADTNRVNIYGLTKLGMLELTRKKTDVSLLNKIAYNNKNMLFNDRNYSSYEAVQVILRDIPFYYAHHDRDTVIYALGIDGMNIVKQHREQIVKHLQNYCALNNISKLNVVFAMDEKNNTMRLVDYHGLEVIKICI